ncbi:methyltransferase domain-containing protein [Saccharolobus solfataricus]|uniref:Ubiquinone/menaquinone biosynthesis methyltransferase n=3 Tax=Saccharolobus solfataricus TaxID=2287 RepID=Q97XD7_SACS2|nr:class I SAM-dependent methyltransferase [Saccharolobus solfataricus]AAK42004.1 Ubiquinone/menaquinone biosynthesis methyltransferase [Saccharolobus solfataricus P2]AKA74720.1 methyltransferase domain-containing protein [Saccharolobus solfataricus]AKA77415.1 methyltransferase domain-containing protein [Saccharolobus solfataricus]AKA80106.1 methyltransferase domain-containing protein [Saccharolobus solfataricus]AZF69186.1 methyltransferase domain-containing protein [Saccharolobus solfataricus
MTNKAIKATNEELQQVYNDIPKAYDRANRFISFNQDVKWRADLVKTILKYCKRPKLILDVASGKGELSYTFKKIYKDNSNYEIILSDYAENMLKMALIKDDKVLCSFDALPFREKTFDIVMSSFALHASDNIEDVIREITRVSRKIVGFIAMGKPDSWVRRIYLSIYLKYIMPYIAVLGGAKARDFKYIYYIYERVPTNSQHKRIFEKYIDIKVYEERALNLFYFVVGFPKE